MRIHIHDALDSQGNKVGEHCIHTERVVWNQVEYPVGSGIKMDLVDFLKGIHSGAIPIAGTGWDQLSNLPNYAGKTHLQAAVSEIVRLNDAAAKATLGV
jgi:hypothetical protein